MLAPDVFFLTDRLHLAPHKASELKLVNSSWPLDDLILQDTNTNSSA